MKKTLLLLSILSIGSISAVKRTIINNSGENIVVFGIHTTFIGSGKQVILETNEESIQIMGDSGFSLKIDTTDKSIISIKKELGIIKQKRRQKRRNKASLDPYDPYKEIETAIFPTK